MHLLDEILRVEQAEEMSLFACSMTSEMTGSIFTVTASACSSESSSCAGGCGGLLCMVAAAAAAAA